MVVYIIGPSLLNSCIKRREKRSMAGWNHDSSASMVSLMLRDWACEQMVWRFERRDLRDWKCWMRGMWRGSGAWGNGI